MAQYEEITIDQGADVALELFLVNQDGSTKDLTNHSAFAKMKNPSTDGIATISLTNIQTDALKTGRYVYDVEISFVDSDGDNIVERVLEGIIEVTPSVTR